MEIIGEITKSEPITNGLFVVVGALITFLATSVTGRRADVAADRRAWYDKISTLFLDLTNKMEVFEATHGINTGDSQHFRPIHLHMVDALETFSGGMTRLQLMCSKSTVKAATKYYKAAEAITKEADNATNPSPAQQKEYADAKERFVAKIRKDLNIKKPLVTL